MVAWVRFNTGGETWKRLSVWLALAGYAVGTSLLICTARLDVIPEGETAVLGGYATGSAMFWVVMTVFGVIATRKILTDPRRKRAHSVLAYVNIAAMVLAAPLYVQTQVNEIRGWARDYDLPFGSTGSAWSTETKRCIRSFPLTLDPTCLTETVEPYVMPGGEEIFALAALRLSIFAAEEPVSILPGSYRAGSPVIVNTSSRWLNVFVAESMLPGVPEDRIVFFAPSVSRGSVSRLSGLEGKKFHSLSTSVQESLRPLFSEAGEIWYITTTEIGTADPQALAELRELGFEATPVEVTAPRYRNSAFEIKRMARAAPER